MQDLALFGGPKAFETALHVGRPNLPPKETFQAYVDSIFESKWLSNNGPLVQEFERKLCEYLGVRNAIVVCNATIGIEVAMQAMELKGKVIVPGYTFIATAHAVKWQGCEPVFCDVDPNTHLIDIRQVEDLIDNEVVAILPVHLWGQPCHPNELQEIADRHGIKLLFDAAHAFGCRSGETKIGNFGNAEVFSFHATKFFQTFEGGAITTNDDELAKRIRLMINFGFAGYDRVDFIGTNAKMTEPCAAMGLSNLAELENYLVANRHNMEAYQRGLAGLDGVNMFAYKDPESVNQQYVVVEIGADCPLTRDELVQVLWNEGCLARRYFYPGCHRAMPYSANPVSLPVTERLCDEIMILPTGVNVSLEEIACVTQTIRLALGSPIEVREKLSGAS